MLGRVPIAGRVFAAAESSTACGKKKWENVLVVGDDFRMIFYHKISPKGRIKLILSVSRAKNREEHHCESVLSPNLQKPNEILDFYRFLPIF